MRAWLGQLPTEARWVVAATLASFVFLLAVFAFQVTATLLDSLQQTQRYEPKIARLLGYEASAQELQTAARAFSRALETLAFPEADEVNSAGARLQQTLRGFAEEAGLIVVGSQLAVVSPEEGEGEDEVAGSFNQLAVDLSLDGPPIALDAFLVAISQHTPTLTTVSIDIQRKRRSRRDGKDTLEFLTVRLSVVALEVAE